MPSKHHHQKESQMLAVKERKILLSKQFLIRCQPYLDHPFYEARYKAVLNNLDSDAVRTSLNIRKNNIVLGDTAKRPISIITGSA